MHSVSVFEFFSSALLLFAFQNENIQSVSDVI